MDMTRRKKPFDIAEVDRLYAAGRTADEIWAITGFARWPVVNRVSELQKIDRTAPASSARTARRRASRALALTRIADLVRVSRCACGRDVIYLATQTALRCDKCLATYLLVQP